MKLTPDGCRARQQKLLEILADQNLDGAVLAQREHVYYFTGHLHNPMHAAKDWKPASPPPRTGNGTRAGKNKRYGKGRAMYRGQSQL